MRAVPAQVREEAAVHERAVAVGDHHVGPREALPEGGPRERHERAVRVREAQAERPQRLAQQDHGSRASRLAQEERREGSTEGR